MAWGLYKWLLDRVWVDSKAYLLAMWETGLRSLDLMGCMGGAVTSAATILTSQPLPTTRVKNRGVQELGVSHQHTIVDSHSEFIPAEVPRALMSGERRNHRQEEKNRVSVDRRKSRWTSQSRKAGGPAQCSLILATAAPGADRRERAGTEPAP